MRISPQYNLRSKKPHIAVLWHPTKNGSLVPEGVSPSSHSRVWWQCKRGHEWQATVGNMARNKHGGCPVCWLEGGRTRIAIARRGSLLAQFPSIAREWHPLKNGNLSPADVTSRSSQKAWWLCHLGHEWRTPISVRTSGHGCPYCGFKKTALAISDNALNRRGPLAITHPLLVAEWHKSKNGDLTPYQVSANTHRKVWWKCQRGHEWQTEVKVRTAGHGCPFCVSQTSRLEIRLLCELRAIFAEVDWRKKWGGIECDIYIPSISCAVEIDGRYWHSESKERDDRKNDKLAKIGINLIRIRGEGLKLLGPLDISYSETEKQLLVAKRLMTQLARIDIELSSCGRIQDYLAGRDYLNKEEYHRILASLPSPEPENSFGAKFPDLAGQWHNRNLPLTPMMFKPYSTKKVWWMCSYGHEYESSLRNRAAGGGCPICARANLSSSTIRAAIARSGRFSDLFPSLLAEWHPTKNRNLSPSNISAGSKKTVWWMCKQGHEWATSVCNRTKKRGSSCPICVRKIAGHAISAAAVKRSGSLSARFPDIAQEWNVSRNQLLTPNDVSPFSGKRVWWRCENGHEWRTAISARTAGSNCPYCGGSLPTKETSLLSKNPGLSQQWHSDKNGGLTPNDVLPNSNKRVWWICKNGHEWEARIADRTRGGNCPYCRSLSFMNPGLSRQWHPDKNEGLTPNDVLPNSNKKVWWICKNGHEWEARIADRSRGSDCPRCRKLKSKISD